jgi:hypothetical protein
MVSLVSAAFPVATLAPIIDALPKSCVNLELDTGGWDASPKEGDPHLCVSIRRVLPRMQHVRLRLRFMCSAIFGEGHLVPSERLRARSICYTKEYEPISLPNMRTLLVNCALPDRAMRDTCRPDDWEDLPPEGLMTRTAWHVITSALERLIQRGDCHSPFAKIHVHDFMSGCPLDMKPYGSPYTTFIRTEMSSLTSWAFPAVELLPLGEGERILVRMPDGQDLISSLAGVESLVEGELWKTTMEGARLPAELAPAAAFPAERDSVLTPDQWRPLNQRVECQ